MRGNCLADAGLTHGKEYFAGRLSRKVLLPMPGFGEWMRWRRVKKFLHYRGICDNILTVGSGGFAYGYDMRV